MCRHKRKRLKACAKKYICLLLFLQYFLFKGMIVTRINILLYIFKYLQ
uniref:Uncharacterized protein n=1 Tax=Lepeophtheirus salmonis TaxID=72036 RepID=A0A0K2V4J2_LEPSM